MVQGITMTDTTRLLIDEAVASIARSEHTLAQHFQTLTNALLNSPSLTDPEKLAIATLLVEIVENLARTPDHRRSERAMTFLVEGFTRVTANVADIAPLWAGIEPMLRQP
jgi:hypothetical protein